LAQTDESKNECAWEFAFDLGKIARAYKEEAKVLLWNGDVPEQPESACAYEQSKSQATREVE
jgi:hypothetical protein